MDNMKLAKLLFPHVTLTSEDLELRYPPRDLPEGARVTRFAPSPTGYMHIGNFFGALTDKMVASASNGICYIRIEDTDKKREVSDGVSAIINGLHAFGVEFNEGVTGFGTENGDYGPYTQSQRVEIDHAVAKRMVENGLAYPCFCTSEELTALREQQEAEGALIRGYFGKYAKCRELTLEQIEANIAAGKPWVLRFRSQGSEDKRTDRFLAAAERQAGAEHCPVAAVAHSGPVRRLEHELLYLSGLADGGLPRPVPQQWRRIR